MMALKVWDLQSSFICSALTTGFEYILSLRHLMRGYSERERQRDTQLPDALELLRKSVLSQCEEISITWISIAQVSTAQPQPAQALLWTLSELQQSKQ